MNDVEVLVNEGYEKDEYPKSVIYSKIYPSKTGKVPDQLKRLEIVTQISTSDRVLWPQLHPNENATAKDYETLVLEFDLTPVMYWQVADS